MSRYFYTLNSKDDRVRAINTIAAAPDGARVEIKAGKRSLPQNSRMWAMLTDIAQQLPWHGQRLRPDDWKLLFLDALKRETKAIPNLEGSGVVSIDKSSSDLSKGEMSDMIELMFAFGSKHNVTFHDQAVAA